MLKLRRRHRTLAHLALLFACVTWLVSAASLVCGRPMLHKTMAMDADCAMVMVDDVTPEQHHADGDCSDRPCLQDSQPYDLVQIAKSDTPQLLALLITVFAIFMLWLPRLAQLKPPDPPNIRPIPLFLRYCVLRN